MAYGDTTRTRTLAGNPSTTNVSGADVTQAVTYGDSVVNTFTAKSDWSSADVEWALVQTTSEYFWASYIVKRFFMGDDTATAKAKELEDEGYRLTDVIRKFSASRIMTLSQSYRTYPLNSSATPYRSISGGSNGLDDSDLS